MTCVVFGGSRHISKLSDEVRVRIDRIVQQQFQVVVGDANGADKAVQKDLADRAYKNVEVFCSGTSPRNNVGRWPCRHITTKAKPGTFEFYAAKDQAMAKDATVGFMLWDGESVGTMLNVWRLMQQQKTSLVYVQSQKKFFEIRGQEDWRELLGLAAVDARAAIEKRIRAESPVEPRNELPLFGPDLHSVGLT
jgi:hypothetical protein